MRNIRMVVGVAVIAVAATVTAKDYPLTFKKLTVDEAMAFPGGYGAYGSLSTSKPSSLRKEPTAVSKRPLYGEVGRNGEEVKGFIFRVDESEGDGKGYDQVIVDFNQNGDLTDDSVGNLAGKPQTVKTGTTVRETIQFGPIEVPAEKQIGSWRPVYYAQMIYYSNRVLLVSGANLPYLGQFRLKPGWYLETTVDLDGRQQKVGVVDGDANLHLGDVSKPETYTSGAEENWYFPPADSYLQDRDGSGKFENNAINTESSPFGSMLYFGATPYRATLAEDYASLRVEPWPDALAELRIQPQGEQVGDVFLAWKTQANDWVLLKAGVAQGTTKVPPGNLRFYGCVLAAQSPGNELLMIGGSYRKLGRTVKAQADQTATLCCGPPLEMKVSTLKRDMSDLSSTLDLSSEDNESAGPMSDVVLQIRAQLVGVAGEIYSAFATGKSLSDEPPKPHFAVLTKEGRTVVSGNLEFG